MVDVAEATLLGDSGQRGLIANNQRLREHQALAQQPLPRAHAKIGPEQASRLGWTKACERAEVLCAPRVSEIVAHLVDRWTQLFNDFEAADQQ